MGFLILTSDFIVLRVINTRRFDKHVTALASVVSRKKRTITNVDIYVPWLLLGK
jgi:hypothetical protein